MTFLAAALEASSIPRARRKICRFSRCLHPRGLYLPAAVKPIWPSMLLTAPLHFREGTTFTGRWWEIPLPTAAVQRWTTTCISTVWEGRELSCLHGARCSEVSPQPQQEGTGTNGILGFLQVTELLGHFRSDDPHATGEG